MGQGAYVGLDKRPHIAIEWHGPAGPIHLGKDLLIDSGATISGIDANNAVTLRVSGLHAFYGVSGPGQQAFIVEGGEMRFTVSDGAGTTSQVSHSDPIIVLGTNLLGADVCSALGLSLTWNFNTQPATVTLSR